MVQPGLRLSGPRRPWVGALRDYVLGCRLISGMGTHMRFGGQVMKNVAGYDVSRLMVGAQLGVITEVSFKVLPRPRSQAALALDVTQSEVAGLLRAWRDQSRPITGAAWQNGRLHLRLEGGDSSVRLAQEQIGGDVLEMWSGMICASSVWPSLTRLVLCGRLPCQLMRRYNHGPARF